MKKSTAPILLLPRWCQLLLCCAAIVCCQTGYAQTVAYPNRPITLISPFAAGGTSDTISRALARELEADLKQAVVVLNRVGAGGTVGITSVIDASHDGYTLVLGGLGSVVFPSVVHKGRIKYDPAQDLLAIGVVGRAPTLILAKSSLAATSLKEVISQARSQPNKLSFASAGVGGTLHLAGVLLEREAGIALNHVPYRGGAPAMTDLAAGNVDLAFADLTLAQPFLQSGKVKPLAVASASRIASLANVPTTAEIGLKAVKMDTWYGLFAPSGTPLPVIERLTAAFELARKSPAFVQTLQVQGISPVNMSQLDFRAALKQDFELWTPLLKRICSESSCD
jgi:tripartite-type tricarboxylate transporter receptor subunit TctC